MSLLSTLADAITVKVIRFVPTPSAGLPTGTESNVQTIVNWAAGIAGLACLVGLIVAGAKMAAAKRHNEQFDGGGLMMVLGGGVVIAAAAPILTAIGL